MLLPKKDYTYIKCDLSDYFLIRYFDKKDDGSYKDDLGNIRQEFLYSPSERIQDLSTSLLGYFLPEHTRLAFTKKGVDEFATYCDPNHDAISPIHPDHFFVDENRFYYIIQIAPFAKLSVTFTRGEENRKAECFIKHTPTKGNFWHFSIRWEVDGVDIYTSGLSEKEKGNLSKKIGHKARAYFAENASDILPEIITLEAHFFSN